MFSQQLWLFSFSRNKQVINDIDLRKKEVSDSLMVS